MWKDSETKADYLDFDYLKMILKDIIENEELSPSSIGIYGDWGSGKSSLMGMLEEEIKSDEKMICIKFNGWLFEGYDDAKTSFLGSILDELAARKGAFEKAKDLFTKLYKNLDLLKLASSSLKSGAGYLMASGVAGVPGLLAKLTVDLTTKIKGVSEEDIEKILKDTLKPEELRKNIKSFKKDFKKLLDKLEVDKVVIFIDELDRCNSHTIIETLEAIRLFIFAEKTNFIIGADERHVQNAVEQKFKKIEGSSINIGKEYLEKLIQYPVKIPPLSKKGMKKYIICLFLSKTLNEIEFTEFIKILNDNSKGIEFDLSFNFVEEYYPKIADKVREDIFLAERLSPILAQGLNGNPRHCKRFLNTLIMREKMGKYKGVTLNRDILSKIMILEYFHTYSFNKLPSLLNFEGNIENIEKVETDTGIPDDLKEFALDEKISTWIKSEPSLSKADLRPYLYFSKESFGITNNINSKLSSNAEEILKGLLSGSDSLQIKFLTKTDVLTNSEANILFELLKEKIYNNTNIENKKLILLIKYCTQRTEQKSSLIDVLSEIPSQNITFGIFPILKTAWIAFNKDERLSQTIKIWVKDNKKLETVFDKNFSELKGE